MSAFEILVLALLLVIAPTMIAGYRSMARTEAQIVALGKIALESVDSAVHDSLHPVFSAKQVRQERLRFERQYEELLRLQNQQRQSEVWKKWQSGKDELSADMQKEMRTLCEAIVESECTWRVYAFMVSGNLRVSNRGESGKKIIEEWLGVVDETRGHADPMALGCNKKKLHRVNQFLEPWTKRLIGETPEDQASPDLFLEVWENRHEWEFRFRYA